MASSTSFKSKSLVASFAALATFAFLAVGCASEAGDDDDEAYDDEDATVGATEEALVRAGGMQLDQFGASGCADPGVTKDGNRYLMSCTGGSAKSGYFRTYQSTDMVNWRYVGQAIAAGGIPWATTTDVNGVGKIDTNPWAPEIHHVSNGYALIFSIGNPKTRRNTVSIAYSKNATGPYTGARPLVSKSDRSTIDGHLYKSGNEIYAYWKDDSTNRIRARKMTPDARNFVGAEHEVLRPSLGWERGGAEGPFLTKLGSKFFMFYSGGTYTNSTYSIGVGRSSTLLGDFTRDKRSQPITHSKGRWYGAGHNSVVRGPDGRLYMILHAYDRTKNDNVRYPILERVVMDKGWPVLRAP